MLKSILKKLDVNPLNVAGRLTEIPKKPVDSPSYQTFLPGYVSQADLLYLPHDGKFKYLLVVVDVVSRAVDAEPLIHKTASAVVDGFKAIYKRKFIQPPKTFLQVDAGSEFKTDVLDYFTKLKVSVRRARAGRHKQQAIVEYYNGIIGGLLNSKMADEEEKTKYVNTTWVKYVPTVINELNKYKKEPKHITEMMGSPLCSTKKPCELMPVDLKVRVALEKPIDVASGKKLNGKFRRGDRRWEDNTYLIRQQIIEPQQPPMYLVDKIEGTAFVKEELQPIITPENEKYLVQKIVSKKGNQYQIKWVGYKEPTWEPVSVIKKDVPRMADEFESRLKKSKLKSKKI